VEPIISMCQPRRRHRATVERLHVTRKWSRMIAPPSRSITLPDRTPRQVLLARHAKAGSRLTPIQIAPP
jgi:hypothetical protein